VNPKTLSPSQALLVFRLLFTGETPKLSSLKPKLSPRERKALEAAGFFRLEKRGRASHLVPTDRAWEWASRHLDAPLSRSGAASEALEGLLRGLKRYLDAGRIPLVELCSPAPEPDETRIREAYRRSSGGRFNVRVRIAGLKEALPGFPAAVLDALLARLHREGRLVLMPLDDPRERDSADEAAAVSLQGFPHHIVYLEG